MINNVNIAHIIILYKRDTGYNPHISNATNSLTLWHLFEFTFWVFKFFIHSVQFYLGVLLNLFIKILFDLCVKFLPFLNFVMLRVKLIIRNTQYLKWLSIPVHIECLIFSLIVIVYCI